MDEWDATATAAMEAFENFVSSKPDDATVIDTISSLTGAQLHIVQWTLEDMAVDYDAVLGARAA